ncbi:hypothetical protein JL722_3583 [Aureococcus anophagefferens]|nr:hypothetical protein JL722_3583 [Aureococcus anophagefferens]
MADAEAKERLLGLLGYVKDMSAPSESEPCKDLASAPIVVHEALLRDVAGAGAVEFEGPCGAWLRVRRPEATGASRQSAAGKRGAAARSLYAELFGARQEALREGRGAALTLGVGLLRWPAAGVEHPLVLVPASLELAADGSFLVRRFAGVGAALWPMPGVAGAGQIVPELETCGRDYGLLGRRREAPSPFDRDAWRPLLHRAAHLWAPTASWSTGRTRRPCPRSPPQRRRRTGRRCTTAPCSSAASRARTRARDAEALSAALRRRTAPLPAALRRLAGDFSAPPAPAPAGVAGLWRAAAKWWRGPAAAAAAPVYFGLPSNDAQASVVATLEAKGCAVLVGPPGTGKSQTIANVICHYLALGRRVLVTSKGEPATEVLRKKLPDGIRELCVSLGSGDGGSFRRLEAAVEYLADTAPERELRAAADRARQRHDAARAELDAFDAEDAARARKYFGRSDLAADLGCHADHLRLLGLSEGSSARHAAEAVARVGEAPFLADVDVDPRRPPPDQRLLDELRELRAAAAAALRWEPQLTSRAARLAERLDVGAARDAAQRLRERNDVAALVRRGDLPRPRGARARAAETEVPPVLLRMVSAAKLDAPLAAPADDDDDAAVAAAVVGANDFFEEVRWRALRPDRRPFLAGLVRARPTATLAAELDEITVFGRRPKTPNEWELVLARLVLRGCAERFREALARLDGYARRGEGAPPTPGAALARAFGAVGGLSSGARRACASPFGADLADAAARGAAALDGELRLLRRALKPATSADARDAAELQAALLAELGEAPRAGDDDPSPVDALRNATAALGGLETSVDDGVREWRRARRSGRRAALGDVDKLRALARAKLARIAPAWAKRVALGRALERDGVLDAGRAGAGRRLLARRDDAVRSLVAAVARHALRGAMAPETCAALVRLVSAVAAAGATAGGSKESVRAARHREDLASAMADCSDAVPCWIMPTYRVSSCLPATLASFDLVVLDEASQSDVAALPALLRGARVLVVGDQKQVSPTSAFVSEAAVRDLKRSLLASGHPFVEQVLPGRSVFDLAQTCFADARCALSHHFRCVPQCIAFSNAQFYHDRLLPRRLPPRSQRLTPALVDVKVPAGKKKGKTNEAEAAAVVAYLAAQLAPGGELATRGASVCVISLLGVEQARSIRRRALEALTAAQLARHDVVVGDPASLQGDERDVVLLSLVASPKEAPAQVGRLYEQRFNVALSRARDRVVLFRSLELKDVPNADDLKHRTLAFFQRAAAARPPRAAPRRSPIAASTAVLEDALGEDRRICVCVDGAGSLDDHLAAVKEQRVLERSNWVFVRLWTATWVLDREACERKLALACNDAGGPKAKKPKSAPKAAAAKPKKAAKKRRASDDDSDGEWDGD